MITTIIDNLNEGQCRVGIDAPIIIIIIMIITDIFMSLINEDSMQSK